MVDEQFKGAMQRRWSILWMLIVCSAIWIAIGVLIERFFAPL